MNKSLLSLLLSLLCVSVLTQCSSTISEDEEYAAITARNNAIAQEPAGNFFYGRRYFIPFTRFWGYVREPRERWSKAKLVIIDESQCKTPDRLPETRSKNKVAGADHGYDANYEYKLYGHFTGGKAYEPNTDQVLPVFKLTRYELLSKQPSWLFTPREKYSTDEVSYYPDLIPHSLR